MAKGAIVNGLNHLPRSVIRELDMVSRQGRPAVHFKEHDTRLLPPVAQGSTDDVPLPLGWEEKGQALHDRYGGPYVGPYGAGTGPVRGALWGRHGAGTRPLRGALWGRYGAGTGGLMGPARVRY